MGKCRNATKGGSDAQKGISPTPSSCVGKAGYTGDVICDLRDEVALLEEALSQMGASFKMPFYFVQHGGSPPKWSLMPEHQQSNLTQGDWTCYCIWVRVTLGEGQGDQPPPSIAWTSSLIADMFQDSLEEKITEAVVLVPREAVLILEDDHLERGSLWMKWGMLDSTWVA